MSIIMNAEETERFIRVCKVAALRTDGGGLTLKELGDAGALAREMESDEPNVERVEMLAARLSIEVEEIDR